MSIGQQILFFISLLGAFNGLVLTIYLFAGKKVRSVSAFFLGLLLLALCIRVTHAVFLYFNTDLPRIYCQIGFSACFLIGPSLYYFSKSQLTQVSQIPASWKWGWGIQLGFIALIGVLFPFQTSPWVWNKLLTPVIYGQWIAYVVATGFLFKDTLKAFFNQPSTLKATEKFWLLVYAGNSIILLTYLLILTGIIHNICMTGPISFSFFLYLSVFFYGSGPHKGITAPLMATDRPGKSEKRRITDNDAQVWITRLEKAITDRDLYKDPNLKLNDLAQKINITTHQLSQLLNDNLGKSFSTYINEYRIREACKLITTDSHLTFEAIGYEVGYNSKSTFYTAFKKVTDTTPALFKEGIAKNNAE
jgi:AraC-like DNA-binding protein